MSDTKTWFLKNMLCSCCKVLLKERLEAVGLEVLAVELGEVNFVVNEQIPEEKIIETISSLGYEIIEGRDSVLVEKIKLAVIDLVHHLNNMNSIIRKSDYLVEKLGMSYQQLSKTFSQHEPITLEKYIPGVFKKVCHFFFAGISLKAGGRKAYPCKFKDIFHNGFQNVQLARVGWVSN
jgi:AraC family transcriptional regulator